MKTIFRNKYYAISSQEESVNEASLHIYGEIGFNEDSWGEGNGTNNKGFALVKLIKNYSDKYKRLNIHINSPGGIVDDGLAIYNTIRASKADVHTYNDGVVASMAGIIFLAGHTRHVSKASMILVHQPSTITMGNIKEHVNTIKALESYQKTLVDVISDRTGMDSKEVEKMYMDGADHLISSEDAINQGFADVLENYEAKKLQTKKNKSNLIANLTQKIVNIFETKSITKPQPMNKIKSYIHLRAILALGVAFFSTEEADKVAVSEEDLSKINETLEQSEKEKADALKVKEDAVKEKETIQTDLETSKAENKTLSEKIAEMQLIIDKTPATKGVHGSTTKTDAKGIVDVSDLDADLYKNLL